MTSLVTPLYGISANAVEAVSAVATRIDFTRHGIGYVCVAVFVVAYLAVVLEEKLHLRKSKPVMLAAGIIWLLVAAAYAGAGAPETAAELIRENLVDFCELFLFILAATTYVNTMEERNVFDTLRAWLIRKRLTLRRVYWVTGALAFSISPMIDNLTTALVMGTVVLTVGRGSPRFIALACINVVVAANAGGAFSPFGDITTLMVWQAGILPFEAFFRLFLPSVVNWLVPAALMSLALPGGYPATSEAHAELRRGALVVIGLFAATVATAVLSHNLLHIPPVLGMMTGLAALHFFGYYLRMSQGRRYNGPRPLDALGVEPQRDEFDIFRILQRAEWDTLMFFYGVILSVGGLASLGYLAGLADFLYGGFGPTRANVAVGVVSAIVDNIPVMFSVIEMHPTMSAQQWLLVTLTTGVGGSLLSVGSAAGVALMGQARGIYTFMSHLRWTWAVALGYVASILVHLAVNGS